MLPYLLWLTIGAGLIIAEMATATFYLLSVAVGAFAAAAVAYFMKSGSVDVYQISACVAIGLLCALILPRMFASKQSLREALSADPTSVPIGTKTKLVADESGHGWKVEVYGTLTSVASESTRDDFRAGEMVTITGRSGMSVTVVR